MFAKHSFSTMPNNDMYSGSRQGFGQYRRGSTAAMPLPIQPLLNLNARPQPAPIQPPSRRNFHLNDMPTKTNNCGYQMDPNIAQIWNKAPTANNNMDDIWKSPDEDYNICNIANQLKKQTLNHSPILTNGSDDSSFKAFSFESTKLDSLETVTKSSLCCAFILQGSCDAGEDCMFAHTVMELGTETKKNRRSNSNTSGYVSDSTNSLSGENSVTGMGPASANGNFNGFGQLGYNSVFDFDGAKELSKPVDLQ